MTTAPEEGDRAFEEVRARVAEAAQLLRALASEPRLAILCLLAERPHSVSELNAVVQLSQPALSQHLAVLRRMDLVRARREGQAVHYSLASEPALEVIQTLHRIFCASVEVPGPIGASEGGASRGALGEEWSG